MPGGSAEVETGKSGKRGLDVHEERQQQESSPQRRGWKPFRNVAVEYVEFQDAGVVVGNSSVAEENGSHASTARAEEIWPVTLDLSVLQEIEAESVQVEAQAGLEVADHHDGVMYSSGHGKMLATTAVTDKDSLPVIYCILALPCGRDHASVVLGGHEVAFEKNCHSEPHFR